MGYPIVAGGTDNHLMIIDTKAVHGVTGSKVDFLCDLVNVSLNKNTVPGDSSPLSPSGIRIGTPAMTTRNCNDWDTIAIIIDNVVKLTQEIQNSCETKGLAEFKKKCIESKIFQTKIQTIKSEVEKFSRSLYFPTKSSE